MNSVLEISRVRSLLIVLACAALAACAQTRGGTIPYEVDNFGAPDPLGAAILSQDYNLAPGDKLSIAIFRVEDLSGEYTVDLAGNINFPLIGPVRASDLTAEQLARTLEQRLSVDYLRDPDVTVSITESVGRRFAVDGSVQQPGVFPIVGRTTLIEAIAQARGTDEGANPRRVAIFRRIDGQRMAAAFDLVSIRAGEAEDPLVFAGDVIVVDGTKTRSIVREILGALPILALFRPY